MKALALGALLLTSIVPPAIAARCQLTDADFAALRLSFSKIQSQNQIDSLDEAHQEKLCITRSNFAKFHQHKGELKDPAEVSSQYLSPTEKDEYMGWVAELFNKAMKEKGFGTKQ